MGGKQPIESNNNKDDSYYASFTTAETLQKLKKVKKMWKPLKEDSNYVKKVK